MSFTWHSNGVTARLARTVPWARVASGYVFSLASPALAIALTRATWPLFVRTPFMLLFVAVFVTARWGTETGAWLAILVASLGWGLAIPAHGAPTDAPLLLFALGAVTVNRIVVSRNRATASLKASESRFRAIWENAGLGAALLNSQGQVESINPAMERILGYPGTAWAGVSFSYFVDPGDAIAQRERFIRFIESGETSYQQEFRCRAANGYWLWCRMTMSPIVHADADPRRGAVMILEDVSERREVENALAASERQYRQLFEDNPRVMWVYDADTGRVLDVNQAAVARYGFTRDEFQALSLWDLEAGTELAAEDVARRHAAEHSTYSTRHRTADGQWLDVRIESHVVRWGRRSARLALADDVTDHKRLEARLNQTQKVEALGQLSGGLAHEFNNVLTSIQGYSSLLLTQISPDKGIWNDLREIERAAERAATVTRHLLAFSRRQRPDLQPVDLNAMVRDLAGLARPLIPEDIEIEAAPAPGTLYTKADVVGLEQVLLNLLINARDAVPRPGGRIAIRTWAEAGRALLPNPSAVLEVSDNGCGMDTRTQARIFEPFFTTKPSGQGTGLGLAVADRIVRNFGGEIIVESEEGHGTTFRIYLPATDDAPVCHPLVPVAAASLPGLERILVVEDDGPLRASIAEVLRRHGYRVTAVGSVEEALAVDDAIDVVLADVVMPRLGGPQLVAQLRPRHPRLLALYMSGHAPAELTRFGFSAASTDLLEKPFSYAGLLTRLRRLLDAEVADPSK